jgi:uncharacterized membrane protein HdeD (DUF308 family)
MKHTLITNWDMVLLNGILAILLGVATLLMPAITLVILVVLFGAYALVSGIMTTIMALKDRKEQRDWWVWLLYGLVGIAAGAVTFVWPGITAVGLIYVIVVWAVVSGILEIVLAIALRKVVKGEWLQVLAGVLSIAFGILCILQPGVGALSILWLIGFYAIAFGVTLVVLAFRLRKLAVEVDQLLNRTSHTS